MVATAAAVIGAGVLGFAGAVHAVPSVETITFTADGIDTGNGKSVTIDPGTAVVFVNKVDPTQGGLLGGLTGVLQSVSVTVSGATQHAFTVGRGEKRTVSGYTSGSQPFVITFHVAYEATNLLQQTRDVKDDTGTITVAATPAQAPTATAGPSPSQQPSQAPSASPSSHSGGTPAPTATDPGSSDRAGGEPTIPSYTPPPSDVASQVVPHDSGGTYHSDSGSGSGSNGGSDNGSDAASQSADQGPSEGKSAATEANKPDTTAGRGHRTAGQQGEFEPANGPAGGSARELPLNTTAAASQTGALPFTINWPAIAALALLSTVAGALVRTFVAHRRAS